MFSLSTHAPDKGQIEFYGMARYRTRFFRRPVFVRWYECRGCGSMLAMNDNGKILVTRKPFSKDENRALFPRGKQSD